MAGIGIFGGCFNPPHKGHFAAARSAAVQLGLRRLIVVPTADPPHKKLPAGTPSAMQRLELVRRAVGNDALFSVSDVELRREGKSYSVDTLRHFQAQYPEDALYLLVGTDEFLSFHQWKDAGQIARMATLVCMRRTDEEPKLYEQQQRLEREYGLTILFAENPVVELSSTTVRRMLFFGCGESYLEPAVFAYIRENGLYGTNDDNRSLPFAALREKSLALHNEKRVPHVIGCSKLAKALAIRYGLDPDTAERAGILHDVTKALPPKQQYEFCAFYRVPLDEEEQGNAKLLHAITASVAAREVFGESEAVCTAIRWHTTGHGGMTTMEKILYIADYAEENRNFDGVEKLRRALEESLNGAMLMGLEMTMEQLRENRQIICRNTLQAHETVLRERNEENHT